MNVRLRCADCKALGAFAVMREGDALRVPKCSACGGRRMGVEPIDVSFADTGLGDFAAGEATRQMTDWSGGA